MAGECARQLAAQKVAAGAEWKVIGHTLQPDQEGLWPDSLLAALTVADRAARADRLDVARAMLALYLRTARRVAPWDEQLDHMVMGNVSLIEDVAAIDLHARGKL